jgi:hypothetical protein
LKVLGNFDANKRKLANQKMEIDKPDEDNYDVDAGCTFYKETDTNIPYSKLKVCRNCSNSKNTGRLVQNRDKNGALNLLRKFKSFLLHKSYPKELSRY